MQLLLFLVSELGERSEGFLADISTLSLYDPNAVYCDEVLLDQAAIFRMILDLKNFVLI
jgi:hypothetical protein